MAQPCLLLVALETSSRFKRLIFLLVSTRTTSNQILLQWLTFRWGACMGWLIYFSSMEHWPTGEWRLSYKSSFIEQYWPSLCNSFSLQWVDLVTLWFTGSFSIHSSWYVWHLYNSGSKELHTATMDTLSSTEFSENISTTRLKSCKWYHIS